LVCTAFAAWTSARTAAWCACRATTAPCMSLVLTTRTRTSRAGQPATSFPLFFHCILLFQTYYLSHHPQYELINIINQWRLYKLLHLFHHPHYELGNSFSHRRLLNSLISFTMVIIATQIQIPLRQLAVNYLIQKRLTNFPRLWQPLDRRRINIFLKFKGNPTFFAAKID
jgi:hypothetical protein